MKNIPIAGYNPFSLSDYPGQVSSVIYTQGCNLRCSFCHNPTTQSGTTNLNIGHILPGIKDQSNVRRAVVLSGGEPTIHRRLPLLAEHLSSLGLLVGLYTNGTNPGILLNTVAHLGFVGLDIKEETEQDSIDCLAMTVVDYDLRIVATNPIAAIAERLNSFILPKKVKIIPYFGPDRAKIVTDAEIRNLRREY